MEDQTQAVSDDDGKFEEETDINPVGYLRVLGQKDLEQTDYPIREGVTEYYCNIIHRYACASMLCCVWGSKISR